MTNSEGVTYAAAGVDVEAGEHAVALMKASIARAQRPEVIGDFGGFAGLFDISAITKYQQPLLATSTDGVGTKVVIAQRMDKHDTIGIDLVAMVVDDLVGQQQVVVKSLEANYGPIDGIGGATILGNGRVALIMDIPGLAANASTTPSVTLPSSQSLAALH